MKIFHVYYVLHIVLRSLWSKAFLVKIIEGITNQMAIIPPYKKRKPPASQLGVSKQTT